MKTTSLSRALIVADPVCSASDVPVALDRPHLPQRMAAVDRQEAKWPQLHQLVVAACAGRDAVNVTVDVESRVVHPHRVPISSGTLRTFTGELRDVGDGDVDRVAGTNRIRSRRGSWTVEHEHRADVHHLLGGFPDTEKSRRVRSAVPCREAYRSSPDHGSAPLTATGDVPQTTAAPVNVQLRCPDSPSAQHRDGRQAASGSACPSLSGVGRVATILPTSGSRSAHLESASSDAAPALRCSRVPSSARPARPRLDPPVVALQLICRMPPCQPPVCHRTGMPPDAAGAGASAR